MSSPHGKTEHEPFLNYTDDDTKTNHPELNREAHRAKDACPKLLTYFLVILITTFFWITIFLALTPPTRSSSNPTSETRHNITSGATLYSCGNTTISAKALGCQYDILLNHWVHASCISQEFIDEYTDDGSWTAYTDEAMTQPIASIEEMGEMEVYWTSNRDHINHCATMWKKQFAVLFEEGRAMDSLIVNPGHTDHCAQYLMDATEVTFKHPTKVRVGFAGCWIRES